MIMLDRPVERGGSSTRHREGAFWECRQLRGTIEVAADADEATIFSLAENDENVQRFIAGRPIRKRIHVPGRVVNFVV